MAIFNYVEKNVISQCTIELQGASLVGKNVISSHLGRPVGSLELSEGWHSTHLMCRLCPHALPLIFYDAFWDSNVVVCLEGKCGLLHQSPQ
jgi:hypothetical protein